MIPIQKPRRIKATVAWVVCVMALVVGFTGTSRAAVIGHSVDWEDIVFLGRTCKVIDDKNWLVGDPHPFGYNHTIAFENVEDEVTSATLQISHWGNYSGLLNPEAWLISASSGEPIGELNASGWEHGWVDQSFDLDLGILDSIGGATWSLNVVLGEYTGGRFDWDALMIDKSVLRVTTAQTPIPGSLWFLGSGLVCLVGLRKKFRG